MNRLLAIICSFFILISFNCSQKQDGYTIHGWIENAENNPIVLLNYDFDTISIVLPENGRFTITGEVSEPNMTFLIYGRSMKRMVLDNQDYECKIKKDEFLIIGKGLHEIVFGFNWNEEFIKLRQTARKAQKDAFENIDSDDDEAVNNAYVTADKYFVAIDSFANDYRSRILEGNYPVMAKVFTIGEHYDWGKYGFENKIKALESYEGQVGPHPYIEHLKGMYERGLVKQKARELAGKGKPFIEIETKSLDGEVVKLSEVVTNNKYTLVEFWASWCGPCRGAFPHLKELYEKYNSKGLEIFGVSMDTDKEAYIKASEEEQIPWINTANFEGMKGKAANAYGFTGIPYTVLIGNDGIIVGTGEDIRGDELDQKLSELLEK